MYKNVALGKPVIERFQKLTFGKHKSSYSFHENFSYVDSVCFFFLPFHFLCFDLYVFFFCLNNSSPFALMAHFPAPLPLNTFPCPQVIFRSHIVSFCTGPSAVAVHTSGGPFGSLNHLALFVWTPLIFSEYPSVLFTIASQFSFPLISLRLICSFVSIFFLLLSHSSPLTSSWAHLSLS